MKTKLWMAAGLMMMVVLFSSVGQATPVLCSQGSMANYISLGSAGCQIDDKIFFNFGYDGTPNAPPASQITITPDPTPLNPGLFFTGGWAALPGQIVRSRIDYTVMVLPGGHLIKDNSLGISGLGVFGDGFVRVGENKCKGGDWLPDGSCSAGLANVVNLNVWFNSEPAPPVDSTYDIAVYPTESYIDVYKEIELRGGLSGFAHMSEVSQHFSEQLPEPSAMLLLGVGLLGIVSAMRRKA